LPSGWGIITASKKDIPVWDAKYIAAEPARTGTNASRKKLMKLFLPERKRKCEKIEAEKPEEAAGRLVEKMRKAGIL
jgi:electron transfer flavoprotein alpha/beta subunit